MENIKQRGKTSRTLLIALSLSAAGLVGIVANEGYTDKAIIPTRGDVPTVGFGSTGGVKLGDTTTPVKALSRALTDVQAYEGALRRCVHVPLHQHEYDAYINLAYNIGPTAFCNSTLVKRLNQEDYAGACAAILDWKMVGKVDCSKPNKVCGGVWQRRLALNRQCLQGAV